MFQLTLDEAELSRSQFATLKTGRGQNIKYRPYASTEHGAIPPANILNSPRAVAMGVYVVRTFVRLRELLAPNAALARKLDELERKYQHHDDAILSAIRELMNPPEPKHRPSDLLQIQGRRADGTAGPCGFCASRWIGVLDHHSRTGRLWGPGDERFHGTKVFGGSRGASPALTNVVLWLL